MNTHVLLINPDMTAGAPTSFLYGQSGKKIARSTYQRNLKILGLKGVTSGHVAKLTLAEYEAAALDISLTSHRRGFRWLVKFVVEQDTPSRAPEVIEFEAGYNLAMDGQPLPDNASPAAKHGWETVAWKAATHAHSGGILEETAAQAVAEPVTQLISEPQVATGADDSHTVVEASSILAPATTPEPLAEIPPDAKYFTLKGLAKAEGVDISMCVGNQSIRAAIIAARERKQLTAVA